MVEGSFSSSSELDSFSASADVCVSTSFTSTSSLSSSTKCRFFRRFFFPSFNEFLATFGDFFNVLGDFSDEFGDFSSISSLVGTDLGRIGRSLGLSVMGRSSSRISFLLRPLLTKNKIQGKEAAVRRHTISGATNLHRMCEHMSP